MNRTKIAVAAFITAGLLFACSTDVGPFFTPLEKPENQVEFNTGHIGLLTPALTKENELIALRVLSGLKVDAPVATNTEMQEAPATGQLAWFEKRKTITDPAAPNNIDPYRKSGESNGVFYENCLEEAFETAARTLEDRRKAYGSAAALKAWVVAQDQVFEDCSAGKPAYPEELPGDASALARADRTYQIAAAHFYAEDFGQAEERFRAIAQDRSSPWQHLAGYLAARTLLREASLQNSATAAAQAREQLTKVANDPSAGTLAASARGLVEHLDAIEHSDDTMEKLSKQFLAPDASAESFQDALHQCSFILRASSFQPALSKTGLPETFDWSQTLEKGGEEHALERWHAKKSQPWLVLALMYASGKDAASAELIQEAERLPEDAPAFETATYNALRLRLERGEAEPVRRRLDELLARTGSRPDSLMDAYRAERMRVATSFDDLLRWAPRIPMPTEFYADRPGYNSPVLAYDSAYILNYVAPLRKLNEAAHSDLLPAWSAADVALAGWTRAFMLNDLETLRQLAPIVAKAHPDWGSGLMPETGADFNRWRFKAALLIALHHEFETLVQVNYRPGLNRGGSWWCAVARPAAETNTGWGDETTWIAWHLPVAFTPAESVLSHEDLEIASREFSQLHDKGSTENFIGPIILDWAKTHPDDPLAPEALHRLVVVTRYGCSYEDPSRGNWSKAAFDLLHKRYPKSPWTAKTPYWFGSK